MEIVFTDRELDVMTVLWELGSATVAEVRERLPDDLAYTTVLMGSRALTLGLRYRSDGWLRTGG